MTSVTLTTPLRLGPLEVPGRLFKSATGETRASIDGHVTDELLEFYEPIAAGGAPLIITGNAFISRGGKGVFREIGADADDKVAGLTELADLVHRYGATIFGQINHCGRQVADHPDPVSASAVREPTTGTRPRPLRADEIPQVVGDYARAAGRLQEARFDGVQVHMAHGYLISQFLTPHTNRRTDEYGGGFDGRLRFAREVLAAVRDRVGPDFPVIAKLNGHDKLAFRAGLETPDLVRVARALEGDGLDAVEGSVSHYESGMYLIRGRFDELFKGLGDGVFKDLPATRRRGFQLLRPLLTVYGNVAWRYSEGFNLDYSREFKRQLSIPIICVGGWQHRDAIEAAFAQGACDAVSAGRSFIADPLLFKHLLTQGEPDPVCTFCNACVAYTGLVPLDCFDHRLRARRDEILREELGRHPALSRSSSESRPER
jgi:2,4-dienoyl-CoA reductase-like NADH-dependent reductase (Old Yellow Enzyme family)